VIKVQFSDSNFFRNRTYFNDVYVQEISIMNPVIKIFVYV